MTVVVSSEPQEAELFVGESKKFDINGDNIYDLDVFLEGITNGFVNLTVNGISEEVEEESVVENFFVGKLNGDKGINPLRSSGFMALLVVIIVFLVLYILNCVKKKKSKRKRKKRR